MTRQWTWGWNWRSRVQVWSTAVIAERGAEPPGIAAEREQGLRGGGEEEREEAAAVVPQRSARSAAGRVKTTWKYGVGRRRAMRASTQRAAARAWHLGQWRLRQEL